MNKHEYEETNNKHEYASGRQEHENEEIMMYLTLTLPTYLQSASDQETLVRGTVNKLSSTYINK